MFSGTAPKSRFLAEFTLLGARFFAEFTLSLQSEILRFAQNDNEEPALSEANGAQNDKRRACPPFDFAQGQ